MFVVIYIPSNQKVTYEETSEGIQIKGKWQVDTNDTDGSVCTYEDLEEALDRIKYIRENCGEACLAVIIE